MLLGNVNPSWHLEAGVGRTYTSVDVPLGHADDPSSELRTALESLPGAVRELYETRGPQALRMFCVLYPQTVTLCETSGITPPEPERFLAFFEGGAAFPGEATPPGVGISNIIKRVLACMLGQSLAPVFAQLPDHAVEDAEKKVREFAERVFSSLDGVLFWIPARVTPTEVIPRLPRLLGLAFSAIADGAVSGAADGGLAQAISAALELAGIEAQRSQDARLPADSVARTESARAREEPFGGLRETLMPGVMSVVAECAAEGITLVQACAALPALAGVAIARAAAIRSSSRDRHRRIAAVRARPRIVRRLSRRRGPRARRHTPRRSFSASSSLDGDTGGDGSGPTPSGASSQPPRPSRRIDLALAELGLPCSSGSSVRPCPVDRSGSTRRPS